MVEPEAVRRGDVFLIALDPTKGHGIRKSRPCVVVSPDELNSQLQTFIVAPLTTGTHNYPFRIPSRFQGKSGYIGLDQIRTVDRIRLTRRLGAVSKVSLSKTLDALLEMFAP